MIKFRNSLINLNEIKEIEVYMQKTKVQFLFTAKIHWYNSGEWSTLIAQEAVDLVMRVGPHILEGNPSFKFAKNAWVFHNLIAHPLMQLCSFLGMTALGLRIHDATIPRPKPFHVF